MTSSLDTVPSLTAAASEATATAAALWISIDINTLKLCKSGFPLVKFIVGHFVHVTAGILHCIEKATRDRKLGKVDAWGMPGIRCVMKGKACSVHENVQLRMGSARYPLRQV